MKYSVELSVADFSHGSTQSVSHSIAYLNLPYCKVAGIYPTASNLHPAMVADPRKRFVDGGSARQDWGYLSMDHLCIFGQPSDVSYVIGYLDVILLRDS